MGYIFSIFAVVGIVLMFTLLLGAIFSKYTVGMVLKWTGSIFFGIFIGSVFKGLDAENCLAFFILTIIFWIIGNGLTSTFPKYGSEDSYLK